jgi:hypothetical protein
VYLQSESLMLLFLCRRLLAHKFYGFHDSNPSQKAIRLHHSFFWGGFCIQTSIKGMSTYPLGRRAGYSFVRKFLGFLNHFPSWGISCRSGHRSPESQDNSDSKRIMFEKLSYIAFRGVGKCQGTLEPQWPSSHVRLEITYILEGSWILVNKE